MAENSANIQLSGLARRLVRDGLLEEDKAREALLASRRDRVPLVAYLVEKGLAKAGDVARTAAEEFGDPLIDLAALLPDSLPKGLVDNNLLVKHRAVPLFKRGNRLFVAVSDPTNLQALEDIRFNTGLNVETLIAEDNKLKALLDAIVNEAEGSAFQDLDSDLEDIDISSGDDDAKKQDDGASGADDAPIVKLRQQAAAGRDQDGRLGSAFRALRKGLPGALPHRRHSARNRQAAGQHRRQDRRPSEDHGQAQHRRTPRAAGRPDQDEDLQDPLDRFPRQHLPDPVGREDRAADSGRGKRQDGHRDALGYEDWQKQLYMDALDKPQGMILVTGPTGSGKTVSLYTGVNILNR
jgi:type IV pilus assembly protein PilB